MKLAIVGVTGLVGSVMIRVLEELNLPVSEFIPVASERSKGKKITLRGQEYSVTGMSEALARKPHIAIFSAGGTISKEWAPRFAEAGTTVIDNSSAWRMDPEKKLIVPEINAELLTKSDKIIANPNCSTIQMVMVLAPLHREFGIKRLVISTYQSYTGTGVKAVHQYELEKEGSVCSDEIRAYAHPIFHNAIPQCDVFLDNGYTREEMKLVFETRKILDDLNIKITATAVRVPVGGGHSESINVEFEKPYELDRIRYVLNRTPGVVVLDSPETFEYPMPLYAKDKNEVFVGRLRRDESSDNGLNMWVVADNLRKGAATNAVQIAQYLLAHDLVDY
jgi:aspartate-semialdehyde dehydrogenase